MKLSTGVVAASCTTVLGAILGISPLKPGLQTRTDPAQPDVKVATTAIEDPCRVILRHLADFYSVEEKRFKVDPKTCSPPAPPQTPLSAEPLGQVHIIIATLPDPVHTHLALLFDRAAEAIQQAAQDSNYTFESSWFPWSSHPGEPSPSAKDISGTKPAPVDDQPGLLLFRKAITKQGFDHANRETLVVFVVGEQATDGIHRVQFRHTLDWIKAIRQTSTPSPVSSVQILGPSFSGSLPSLVDLLRGETNSPQPAVASPSSPLQIYSGQVTNNSSVNWFQGAVKAQLPSLTVNFHSFQQDDDLVTERYMKFLNEIHVSPSQVAQISEDETVYGYGDVPGTTPDPFNIPSFYYPRDISALRAAYQQQALFSQSTSAPPSEKATDTAQRTLHTDLSDPESEQGDSLRTYGGKQSALSQEAALLQIVSMLKSHHTQFILLRSSNPLDQLFLAHFFKSAYPEGRIVTLGNDLLLRRESGSSGLNGIMTLSTYPLLPDIDDWTSLSAGSHSHRAFTGDDSRGTYVALRFLLEPPTNVPPDTPGQATRNTIFLPATLGAPVAGYGAPFWDNTRPEYQGSKPCQAGASAQPGIPQLQNRPVTWLTVLGNSGFAPVAALNQPAASPIPKLEPPPSVLDALCSMPLSGSIGQILSGHNITVSKDPPGWPQVPLSMNLALIAVFLWACFHMRCCAIPSITVKPEHRSYFVRRERDHKPSQDNEKVAPYPTDDVASHPNTHVAMIVGSSVLVVMVAVALAQAFGWMSPFGEPILHPFFYGLFPPLIWGIVALGVLTNAWVEQKLEAGAIEFTFRRALWPPRQWPATLIEAVKSATIPLSIFSAVTFLLYFLYLLLLDGPLSDRIRIPTYFRAMNLTSGLSPSVPFVLLALGMYSWCWQAMRGFALFNADRPLLPKEKDLLVEVDVEPGGTEPKPFLTILGAESAGRPIVKLCQPFHAKTWKNAAVILLFLILFAKMLADDAPLRSLGSAWYSNLIALWIAIGISILLANCLQVLRIWFRLRTILVFMDKLPLRHTMVTMRGYTWSSIWKMSGNVLDMRYKLFYRQFENLNALQAELQELAANGGFFCPGAGTPGYWQQTIESTRPAMRDFAEWYALNWNKWTSRDLSKLRVVQQETASLVAKLLSSLLVPVWMVQKKCPEPPPPGGEAAPPPAVAPAAPLTPREICVHSAEEVVCLHYLGFIQNILGRIRSLVMGMVCLFLSIAFVVPSYPFDPRPVLTGAVVVLFLVIGGVIFLVYSQMFRDATLSHLTNTKAGELGGQFWLKFLSFGVGPLIGLLATISPQLSDFVMSCIQPGLSTLK